MAASTYFHVLTFTGILLFSSVAFAVDYNCSAACRCSSQKLDILGTRKYFVLNCTGDSYNVQNASLADIYYYTSSQLMDTNFLQSFNNLKGLFVSGGIDSLNALAPITSLRLLNISGGNMVYVPASQLFRISASLVSVSLANNRIEYVSDETFGKLDNLEFLNLSRNLLDRLPQGLFYSLRNLKRLDLSHNKLYRISSADFNGLSSLEWLDIGHNSISSLTSLDFGHQDVSLFAEANPILSVFWTRGSDLRLMKISSNKLVFIPARSFSVGVIEHLVLSNSASLKLIEAEAFLNMTILELVISNNPSLQYIDPQAFENINKLNSLILSYNNLHVVPETFSSIRDIQRIVALGNPLFCDCNMNWMRDETTAVEVVISNDTEQLNCDAGSSADSTSCAPRTIFASAQSVIVDEGRSVHLLCKVNRA